MKSIIKKSVNAMLQPAGLRIVQNKVVDQSNRSLVMDRELASFMAEVENSMRATDLPHLKEKAGRHEIIIRTFNLKLKTFYLANYLGATLNLEGDVCEFGVSYGASSTLFANEIMETKKHLWLFDSFEGLPKPTAKDVLIDDMAGLGSIEKYQGEMCQPESRVRGLLDSIGFPTPRLHVIPGFIEETSKTCTLPEKVAFAYIDFDFYEPILLALNLMATRLHPKGYMLVDDFGYFSAGAQTAVEEFIEAQKGKYVLTLPPAHAGKFAILSQRASS